MTLLIVFEALEKGQAKWDDIVTVSENAWKTEGSRMFLEVNQKVKLEDLIYGISIDSANDGVVAVAEYLRGSESAFVDVMNKRASELGLTSAHFANATGLPADGHVISARDIAVLARYLIEKFPKILEIESQKELTFNKIRQFNRNPLIGEFPGADGLKTGWTEEAGYCLVGTAVQNGVRMIGVVLNTPSESARLTASRELLNYGFKNFKLKTVVDTSTVLDNVSVKDGKKLDVPVKAKDAITVVLPAERENEVKMVLEKNSGLEAPLPAGSSAGVLKVQLDDKVLGSTELITTEDVVKAGFFQRLFRAIGALFDKLFS
jgi:D-alanyl-D-alanine carboxypeptidase (penicillin-binding protein 5/6)